MKSRLFLWCLLMNSLDAIVTVHVCGSDPQNELNPLMRSLLEIGPAAFLYYKLVVATAIICFLQVLRPHTWIATPLLASLTVLYGFCVVSGLLSSLLMLYH